MKKSGESQWEERKGKLSGIRKSNDKGMKRKKKRKERQGKNTLMRKREDESKNKQKKEDGK